LSPPSAQAIGAAPELVDCDRVAPTDEFIDEAGAAALIVQQVYTRSSKGHVEEPTFLGAIKALRDWQEGLAVGRRALTVLAT
jgi:hypothetical protein